MSFKSTLISNKESGSDEKGVLCEVSLDLVDLGGAYSRPRCQPQADLFPQKAIIYCLLSCNESDLKRVRNEKRLGP